MPEILAVIQARMGSSRLPGKVLLDLEGQPMLGRVYNRVQRARLVERVVVATTADVADDPVESYCRSQGLAVLRGSTFDVLDRFYQVATKLQAGVVVRITADCPLIDPQVIDRVVQAFLDAGADFAANRLPPPWKRTYPIGLDVEVCSYAGLARAWREADQDFQREHVMPFFYEGIPADAFEMTGNSLVVSPRSLRVLLVNHSPDHGSLRWTVDTPEDLALMRRVLAHFPQDDFGWQDVLQLFEREPGLARLNETVAHKSAFDVDTRHTAVPEGGDPAAKKESQTGEKK